MPFDDKLILKGEDSSGDLIDMDQSDAVAILLTVNDDGNRVVDLLANSTRRSPLQQRGAEIVKGLSAVVVYTEAPDSAAYDDEAVITIEESDQLDRHWQTVVTFPTIHNFVRKIYISATTAFVATDVTRELSEATSNDTGQIIYISPGLMTTGANGGYVLVEMDAVGDVYDEAVGVVETATAGTGVGTKAKATEVPTQMLPGTYIRRFSTTKRYLRCNANNVDDSMGKVWILIGDEQLTKL